jgi:hypothetical protein
MNFHFNRLNLVKLSGKSPELRPVTCGAIPGVQAIQSFLSGDEDHGFLKPKSNGYRANQAKRNDPLPFFRLNTPLLFLPLDYREFSSVPLRGSKRLDPVPFGCRPPGKFDPSLLLSYLQEKTATGINPKNRLFSDA